MAVGVPHHDQNKPNYSQNYRGSRQQSLTKCKFCGVISLARIFIWLWIMICVSADKVHQIQRINYGVVFERQPNLLSGRENWLHTFKIPLPSKQTDDHFEQCDITHQHCYILNQVLSQLTAIRTQVSSNVNHTVEVIHKLIPHIDIEDKSNTESRLKRGLFDFIGSISKSLFGTATTEDVNRLAKHVNILIRRNNEFAKDITHHDKLLSSYMSKTNKRFDNIIVGIKNNYEGIQNITKETAKFISQFEKLSIKLSKFLLKQMNETAEINKYLEELKIAVHELVKGKLSPFLISPQNLKRTIQHIQSILNDKFKGFYLNNVNPSYYYSQANILYTRHHKNLFISIKFPITTFVNPLTLYKINSYPVPINTTSNHATQLLDLPQYLVITSDNRQYAELSDEFVKTCSGIDTLYCTKTFPLLSSVSPSCSFALLFNDKESVHSNCNFRFLTNIIQPAVIEITDTSLLVYKTKTLAFDCPSGHKIEKGCSFCIIHVPCLCSVKTDSLFIPAKIGLCDNNTSTMTIVHPVNLALIQHFFSSETYNSILGDTTFTDPADITLPNLHFYNHTFNSVIAQDNNLHLSLKRIAKAAKADRKIFTSLSEPLLDGEIDIDDSWPNTNEMISLISLVLSILLTIACIVLFNKVRALTTALILLQKAPSSAAFVTPQTPPTFHYMQSPISTTQNYYSLLSPQLNQWPSIVLSAITIISFVGVLHYLYKQVCTRHHTKIILEISNGLTCLTIPVVNLPLCPSDWDIATPNNITNMRISGTFYKKLHVEMSGLSIVNVHTKQQIKVPDTFTVNPIKAKMLRNIFKSPFTSYILVVHNNFFKVVY
ncbi:uncharacterized protein LOC127704385 [Mytilus californianus]|uniref:uncharacterized protein LOC127704385 n=1 Tax=Mytilus californianus TaxID=6549 RepID=UPI00224639E6|nr:uncharacterized protein LOC127704385 [Mytilus californianus]